MKRSKFSDSQILAVLKQAEVGTAVPDLCREHGDVGARAGADRAVRDAGTCHSTVPSEVRQWARFYLSGLHAPRAQLWSQAGVHHSAPLAVPIAYTELAVVSSRRKIT